jgi:hypothetical protein
VSESLRRTLLIIALVFLVIIAVPLLVPLLIGGVATSWVNNMKFKQRYKAFLKANDEMVFFCYSDLRDRHEWIEAHILKQLDPVLNIIFVEGNVPRSEFDNRCVSYMLDHVKNKGCPNLLRISNGQVFDISLQKDMENVFNDNADPAAYLQSIHQKLKIIRQSA